jgi:hypothetical protein
MTAIGRQHQHMPVKRPPLPDKLRTRRPEPHEFVLAEAIEAPDVGATREHQDDADRAERGAHRRLLASWGGVTMVNALAIPAFLCIFPTLPA